MSDFLKSIGSGFVVDSGTAIVTDDGERLTIDIANLKFSVASWYEPLAATITTEMLEYNHILIKINIWWGDDLTFKFKVGTLYGRDLYFAVNLNSRPSRAIITYTFSSRPTNEPAIVNAVLSPATDAIQVDDREIAELNASQAKSKRP